MRDFAKNLRLTSSLTAAALLLLGAANAHAQSGANDDPSDYAPPHSSVADAAAPAPWSGSPTAAVPTPQPPYPRSGGEPGSQPRRERGLSLSGPFDPHFQGGILFDGAVRDTLRAPSERGRRVANVASNVALYSLVAAPFLNAGVMAAGQSDGLRAASEMELVNLEAFGVSFAVMSGFKALVGRERPYATAAGLGQYCRDPEHASEARCQSDRNASFLSGHSAMTFTGAGLVCAQSGFAQGTRSGMAEGMCGIAMATATTTALLRVAADMHYATDTLAGAAVGLLAGFAIPVALHYSDNAPLPVARTLQGAADEPHDWAPMLASAAIGVAVAPVVPVISSLIMRHQREAPLASARHRSGFDPSALNLAPTAMPNGGGGLALGGTF